MKTKNGAPFLDRFHLPESDEGGERFYSFDWGDVHFVCLDSASGTAVMELLRRLHETGTTVLVITHDINLLAHFGSPAAIRVLGLKDGSIAFESRFDAASLPDELARLFGIPMRVFGTETKRVIVPELLP